MESRIYLDKYYTPLDVAKYCIEKTFEIIGVSNITEVIEPSAGNGAFSSQMLSPCISYDISPDSENIIQQDYLKLDIDILKKVNWEDEIKCIAALKIQQYHIIKVLKNTYLIYTNNLFIIKK